MKLLSHIRSKSRQKSTDDTASYSPYGPPQSHTSIGLARTHPLARFSVALLETVFDYVCPHSRDDCYTSCEESMVDGGCMLCDMRDLAHCAGVSKRWSEAAQHLLYHNVRIDTVHYCDREAHLAIRRKRRSFIGRNGDHKDPPQERLQLFARTVRNNGFLAGQVQYLKTPYMTREACMAELAWTVSVLPNLRYVDLPDEYYSDDLSANTLKQELQARCRDLRQMKYLAGAESSFQTLAQTRYWPNLEAIELVHLAVEPATIVDVFASLPALRQVKAAGVRFLDDSVFQEFHQSACTTEAANSRFPLFAVLELQDLPNISAAGLVAYLSQPDTGRFLTCLTLTNTGTSPSSLHQILAIAPFLVELRITHTVTRAISSSTPSLASRSLQTLHFEISDLTSSPQRVTAAPSDSFYSYLSSSILSGCLPSLKHLYALSANLSTLLMPPRLPAYTAMELDNRSPPATSAIGRPLSLYTKAVIEREWQLTVIDRSGSASNTRPISLYHAHQMSTQWRDEGRESVMVGNGFGGLLAVPTEDFGLGNPRAKKGKKDFDAWMG